MSRETTEKKEVAMTDEASIRRLPPIYFDILRYDDQFGIGLRVYSRSDPNSKDVWIAKPVMMQEHEPGDLALPCMKLEPQDLQRLADELGRNGFYPKQLTDRIKELSVNQGNLKDQVKGLADMVL